MKGEFIVITGAVRERLFKSGQKVIKKSYNYRLGDLGLLHPDIIKFFSDFERNLDNYLKYKYDALEVKSDGYWPELIPKSGEWYDLYIHDGKDIPVLLFEGNLRRGGEKDMNYFLTILREGEFTEIWRDDEIGIARGVREAYKDNGIKLCITEHNFFPLLKYQWKSLEYYEVSNNPIPGLPLEHAPRRISDYKVEFRQELIDRRLKA